MGMRTIKCFLVPQFRILANYCLLTLREDQPDVCIINIGSNNLDRDIPHDIYKGIVNIINICHHHGFNDVYVSAIPFTDR